VNLRIGNTLIFEPTAGLVNHGIKSAKIVVDVICKRDPFQQSGDTPIKVIIDFFLGQSQIKILAPL